MNDQITISLYQLFKLIPNSNSARIFLEKQRWGDSYRVCPYCEYTKSSQRGGERQGYYRCTKCKKEFTVRTNSIFHRSHIPLDKWIFAIYMMVTARKGVSSMQLSKELSIRQSSAWFLMHRIRHAMDDKSMKSMLQGIVEVDEAYFGGKEKNKHENKKQKIGRGPIGKSAVVGILQRNGKLVVQQVPDIKGDTLRGEINKNVKPGTKIISDSLPAYKKLNENYSHETVTHSVGEYVRKMAHVNGIESVWALLKRGFDGTFHKISPKHLQRYITEFVFRYNEAHCKVPTRERMSITLDRCWGIRLTYCELIQVELSG